jgi:hypothetical protein
VTFLVTAVVGVNAAGDACTISDPALDGNPDARFVVTQVYDPNHVVDPNEIGTWFDAASGPAGRWAVVNLSGAPMPDGASFHVCVPGGTGGAFVVVAGPSNLVGGEVRLDHAALDGRPFARCFATPCVNPGGVGTVRNAHPVGLHYDASLGHWYVWNGDAIAVPSGAAFQVYVPATSDTWLHVATPANTTAHYTLIDHPSLNGNPLARPLAASNWNPGGPPIGVYNASPIGVFYDPLTTRWGVFNEDADVIEAGAAWNVRVK